MKLAGAALWLSLAACHRHELGSEPHTVERDYARPAALVWSAAVESVKDEGLDIRSATFDRQGGTLLGDAVRITVVPLRETRSRVSIRVGPDDLARARRLHERIAENVQPGGRP